MRLAMLASAACMLVFCPTAAGYEFGPTVRQVGPEQTVFDWTTMRCDDLTVPDLPVRAFRDASGKVQLTLPSPSNRRMIGPSLDSLSVDCNQVTLSSGANADPAAYDDQEWLSSVYTPDGTKVFGLIHDEYHGWDHPGMCSTSGHPPRPKIGTVPGGVYNPGCWYNAITFATSTNGGATYTHATPPAHLAASVPYVYAQNTTAYGYFAPGNLIKKADGYYYVMFQVEPYQAQAYGACLMRTKTPTSPKSWRTWDGTGFNVSFINPYIDPGPPESHICTPVAFNEIDKMHGNVTYNTFYKKYLLVDSDFVFDQGTGQQVWGFYYSTSSDLINWTPRQLIMKGEMIWTWQCGDDNPVAYPALLNPVTAMTDRNFGTTNGKTYLYFTRLNWSSCVQGLDYDLIRIPIQFLA